VGVAESVAQPLVPSRPARRTIARPVRPARCLNLLLFIPDPPVSIDIKFSVSSEIDYITVSSEIDYITVSSETGYITSR
jgi:hypothetical protein